MKIILIIWPYLYNRRRKPERKQTKKVRKVSINMFNTTEVGSRVRSYRKQIKMNQKAMALALNISQPEVSNIEKGKRAFTSEKLAKLAQVLGCDANWLATGTTGSTAASA